MNPTEVHKRNYTAVRELLTASSNLFVRILVNYLTCAAAV